MKKFSLPHFQVAVRSRREAGDEVRVLVTKKIRRAVDRNRVKRVVREFFRREFLKAENVKNLIGRLVICRVTLGVETPKIKNAELFRELRTIIPKRANFCG